MRFLRWLLIDDAVIESIAKHIYYANAGRWSGISWDEAGGNVKCGSTRAAYMREARAAVRAIFGDHET